MWLNTVKRTEFLNVSVVSLWHDGTALVCQVDRRAALYLILEHFVDSDSEKMKKHVKQLMTIVWSPRAKWSIRQFRQSQLEHGCANDEHRWHKLDHKTVVIAFYVHCRRRFYKDHKTVGVTSRMLCCTDVCLVSVGHLADTVAYV